MKKCLIVDDSAFMRMSIRRILDKYGFDVIGEADSGEDAIVKYQELLPDIVTLDITMKGMSGIDALKEIIKFDANANVIMVSSMGQDSIIQETILTGAKGFLIKPFKEDAVISTIAHLAANIQR